MADYMADVKTDEHGTKYYTDADNVNVYFRNCYNKNSHDSHVWKSYWFATKGWSSLCDGSGEVPSYFPNPYSTSKSHYTSTATVKKDYSEDTENFPHSDPITLTQARKIAYDMHKKQKDKSGEDYRLHLNAVQKGVVILGGSEEEQVAALFHDAVEDYHTTYELLRKINVTEDTITMIEAVSKRNGEAQTAYLERIKKAGSGACRVKIADLLHNTRHDRIQALRDDKKGYVADRLLKKYRPALAALMLHIDMIVDEDEQKKIATKPQGSSTGSSTWSSSSLKKPSTAGSSSTSTPKKSPMSSKPSTWGGDSLFVGDWLTDKSAPIISITEDGSTLVATLGNGEVIPIENSSKKQYTSYSIAQWWENNFLFNHVAEEDIVAWHTLIEGMGVSDEEVESDTTGAPLWLGL